MKSKKHKLKCKTKYIKNPDWSELNAKESEKILDEMIDENVILCLSTGIIPKLPYNQLLNIPIRERFQYTKLYGILKKFNKPKVFHSPHKNSVDDWINSLIYYLFQFNPLNQYLYQSNEDFLKIRRNSPTSIHSYNEDRAVDELNLILRNEYEPNYEFKFSLQSIVDLYNNEIYLPLIIKFEPKLIKL